MRIAFASSFVRKALTMRSLITWQFATESQRDAIRPELRDNWLAHKER